ncbi:radical SAM/SPASM domain-containing protein [Actinomadura citrea]|uniref:radical SAM/SPASM domain-containing protein n=1 Tax=Actinomadura citrea TaxID=46158 RepID=UPI003CE50891
MIRIRFPRGVAAPAWLRDLGDHVEVTEDPSVLALEEEKNTDRQRTAVDRVLRPEFARLWSAEDRIFNLVSVETRAGCNHTCTFCPVSRAVDPRPAGELDLAAIDLIARQLGELGYTGRIAPFGNNEPLLDHRLPDIVATFRRSCPAADIRVLTNGILARPAQVAELFEAGLSTLSVNNYSDGRRVIAPIRGLLAEADRLRHHDIRISVRRRTEILTTRAGLAPNKPHPTAEPRGFCALPFTDLHISYTGEVNLCCFDAYGRIRVGNVTETPLTEIWRSPLLARYRASLLRSERADLEPCRHCDFDGFRAPTPDASRPLVRNDILTPGAPTREQD